MVGSNTIGGRWSVTWRWKGSAYISSKALKRELRFSESDAFSVSSYKLIGIGLVVFFISLGISFMSDSYYFTSTVGLIILALFFRRQITIVRLDKRSVSRFQTVLGVKNPFSVQTFTSDAFEHVAIKFFNENVLRTAQKMSLKIGIRVQFVAT